MINERTKKFIQNFYDMATVKWTPSRNCSEVSKHLNEETFTVYEKGTFYYGMPFTIHNKHNLSAFTKQIHNTVYTVPKYLHNIIGADCVSPVIFALEDFLKIPVTYLSRELLWDKRFTQCVGNIFFAEQAIGTGIIRKRFSEQDFYESYAKCTAGNLLITYFPKDFGAMTGHTRLITGSIHCVRDANNDINPVASYIIVSENKHTLITKDNHKYYRYTLDENDFAVPFTGNKKFTDLTDWTDLKNKNTTFRINQRIPFKILYDYCYIPLQIKGL